MRDGENKALPLIKEREIIILQVKVKLLVSQYLGTEVFDKYKNKEGNVQFDSYLLNGNDCLLSTLLLVQDSLYTP